MTDSESEIPVSDSTFIATIANGDWQPTGGLMHGPSRLAWSESWQPTGAELHLSDELSELSK